MAQKPHPHRCHPQGQANQTRRWRGWQEGSQSCGAIRHSIVASQRGFVTTSLTAMSSSRLPGIASRHLFRGASRLLRWGSASVHATAPLANASTVFPGRAERGGLLLKRSGFAVVPHEVVDHGSKASPFHFCKMAKEKSLISSAFCSSGVAVERISERSWWQLVEVWWIGCGPTGRSLHQRIVWPSWSRPNGPLQPLRPWRGTFGKTKCSPLGANCRGCNHLNWTWGAEGESQSRL